MSTSKRTHKQTMADVEDNGFNLRAAAVASSDEEDAKNPEYWVDFYKTSHEQTFANLVRGHFSALDHYSENFLDFLSECLIMDVSQRQSPISLLSHPLFKQLNRNQAQICRQLNVMTAPVVSFEQQFIKKQRLGTTPPIGRK